jgi:hypothetical protein
MLHAESDLRAVDFLRHFDDSFKDISDVSVAKL